MNTPDKICFHHLFLLGRHIFFQNELRPITVFYVSSFEYFFSLLIELNFEATWFLLPIHMVICNLGEIVWVIQATSHKGLDFFLVCSGRMNALWVMEATVVGINAGLVWLTHPSQWVSTVPMTCPGAVSIHPYNIIRTNSPTPCGLYPLHLRRMCFCATHGAAWLPILGRVHLGNS